jgi:hypothetical protein
MKRISQRDAIRALVSGFEAVAVRIPAQVLFDAGGRKLLPVAAQRALRATLEREAARLMMGASGLLKEGAGVAKSAAHLVEAKAGAGAVTAAKAAAAPTARVAAQQVMRGIGRAAGAGALIDGAWGTAEAIYRVRNRTMTPREAVVHVAKEASTGAAATAAGAAAAAAVVTLTGGLAVPAVFVVGAAASIATKLGLNAWIERRQIVARLAAPEPVPAT